MDGEVKILIHSRFQIDIVIVGTCLSQKSRFSCKNMNIFVPVLVVFNCRVVVFMSRLLNFFCNCSDIQQPTLLCDPLFPFSILTEQVFRF